jgi:hypothetical protein
MHFGSLGIKSFVICFTVIHTSQLIPHLEEKDVKRAKKLIKIAKKLKKCKILVKPP